MRVQIQIKGLPGSSKLRRFAAHKLESALSCFSHVIHEATLRLLDINGANRGGADKLCRAVITLKNSSVVVIEELGSNIMQVIERAADRLHQSVSRQLAKLVRVDSSGMRQTNLLLLDA